MFNDVSITATALFDQSGTYTRDPSGVTATPWEYWPTGTVATTLFVAMSRTDTSLLKEFATYANGAALVPAAPANTTSPASHNAGRNPLIDRLPSAFGPYPLCRKLSKLENWKGSR